MTKKTQNGEWCLTVGDVLKFLRNIDPKAAIAMADGANIYVVPRDGKVIFTDLDDDGNEMPDPDTDEAE